MQNCPLLNECVHVVVCMILLSDKPREIHSEAESGVCGLVEDAASQRQVPLRHHGQPRGLRLARRLIRPRPGLDGSVRYRHLLRQETLILHRQVEDNLMIPT